MKNEDVAERLGFAKRRLQELLDLNNGELQGADSGERQQWLQEFFFHLVGATEVLAQLVNEVRGLSVDPELVSVPKVSAKLAPNDPVQTKLSSLHVHTRGKPLPKDPYTDKAYIFRILNYRHQVTHRRRNPIFMTVGVGSAPRDQSTYLLLDPRDPKSKPSAITFQDETRYMLKLVTITCEQILSKI